MHASEIPYVHGFDDAATFKEMQVGDFVASWGTGANESPESGAPMYVCFYIRACSCVLLCARVRACYCGGCSA